MFPPSAVHVRVGGRRAAPSRALRCSYPAWILPAPACAGRQSLELKSSQLDFKSSHSS